MNAPEGKYAKLEQRLRRVAGAMAYPPTPDLAARERQRLAHPLRKIPPWQSRSKAGFSRFAPGLALVLILILAALLVSPARARVLDWIRIGAVRIFFALPTPTAPALTGTPSLQFTPTYLPSVLDLAGETSLASAQEQAGFTLRLPAYPPSLGLPDHVFAQQYNLPAVVLVWVNPDQPEQVRLSLTETSSGSYIYEKYSPKSVLDTQVNGQPAVWIDGNYPLVTRSGDLSMTRLITQSHTLIWTDDELTFRLETDDDLETAIRIAESIR